MLNSVSLRSACRLLVWLALLVLPGCAALQGGQPRLQTDRAVGLALLDDWRSRSSGTLTLKGLATIKVQTAARTVGGTQVILVEAPDRLRSETLSPFGTTLLLLAADGEDIGVYLPGDNRLYRGRATPENLGRFTRMPLRLTDLVGILLARPPLIAYQEMTSWMHPDGGWQIDLEAGPRRQILTFDAARRLSGVQYLMHGEPQLLLVYGEFDRGDAGLPHRLELRLPRQETRVTLDFSELSAGDELAADLFTLRPPADAEIVLLDESAASEESVPANGAMVPDRAKPRQEEGE